MFISKRLGFATNSSSSHSIIFTARRPDEWSQTNLQVTQETLEEYTLLDKDIYHTW
jgi:hypothetical protein